MTRHETGRALIAAAALATAIVPIGVDGALLSKMHMRNPRWLPHAKLHCAMSFFAALGLGAGSLALLRRPHLDRESLGLSAFLATAFWGGLLASGQWPGASYGFDGDPGFDKQPPRVLGLALDPNAALAAVSLGLGWLGYRLATDSSDAP